MSFVLLFEVSVLELFEVVPQKLDGTDDQAFASGFDHLLGELWQIVDLKDALDLCEEPSKQPEVAAGNAENGGENFLRDGLTWPADAGRTPAMSK